MVVQWALNPLAVVRFHPRQLWDNPINIIIHKLKELAMKLQFFPSTDDQNVGNQVHQLLGFSFSKDNPQDSPLEKICGSIAGILEKNINNGKTLSDGISDWAENESEKNGIDFNNPLHIFAFGFCVNAVLDRMYGQPEMPGIEDLLKAIERMG